MKSKNIILTVCFTAMVLVFAACSSQEDKRISRQKAIREYAESVRTVPISQGSAVVDSMLSMYALYIKDYPQDTMSETYLFNMSNIYKELNECDSALQCLDRMIKEFPQGKKNGLAYFYRAMVLHDVCLNREESIKAYETYIEKFPDSKFVNVARQMLQLDTMKNPLEFLKNVKTDE
ncbi:MAG: tetratricopeptide repeat protein [Bacteroidales bacterium]|nr:tetratricopeptide repeat protein [Bacteroidales bacterium]